jgi:hypothetical protein
MVDEGGPRPGLRDPDRPGVAPGESRRPGPAWRGAVVPALLVLSLVLLAAGIARGEPAWLRRYAEILCLTCIGLGR